MTDNVERADLENEIDRMAKELHAAARELPDDDILRKYNRLISKIGRMKEELTAARVIAARWVIGMHDLCLAYVTEIQREEAVAELARLGHPWVEPELL